MSQAVCPTPRCPSPNSSIPVCQSVLSSQSHDPDGQIEGSGGILDRTERQQPANTDPALTSPFQNVNHSKMDDIPSHLEDTLQRNGKGHGEGERGSETVQIQDADVNIPHTERSCSRLVSEEIWNQQERDPQVFSCSLQDEPSAQSKQEELGEQFQVKINGRENELPRRYVVLNDVSEAPSQNKVNPKDLIQIESLDMVFETSVDGSETDYMEGDDFFQQLDTEWQVFWAEPIQISSPLSFLDESNNFEASDGPTENLSVPADSISTTGKDGPSVSPPAATGPEETSRNENASSDVPDIKPLNRSVSVQMSSSPSSHIVHRKDVPYKTESKPTLPSSVLPLDTSTPFRAVQSWTDLQIQRNTLNQNLSHEILDFAPGKVTINTNAPGKTQRPTQMFSSTPSFPVQSKDWASHDSLPGMVSNYRTVSVSVDTGLGPHKEKEVDTIGHKHKRRPWEGNQPSTILCCPSCDHQCTCCTLDSYNMQQPVGNIPVSKTAPCDVHQHWS